MTTKIGAGHDDAYHPQIWPEMRMEAPKNDRRPHKRAQMRMEIHKVNRCPDESVGGIEEGVAAGISWRDARIHRFSHLTGKRNL